jgi:hypothetical protein
MHIDMRCGASDCTFLGILGIAFLEFGGIIRGCQCYHQVVYYSRMRSFSFIFVLSRFVIHHYLIQLAVSIFDVNLRYLAALLPGSEGIMFVFR